MLEIRGLFLDANGGLQHHGGNRARRLRGHGVQPCRTRWDIGVDDVRQCVGIRKGGDDAAAMPKRGGAKPFNTSVPQSAFDDLCVELRPRF